MNHHFFPFHDALKGKHYRNSPCSFCFVLIFDSLTLSPLRPPVREANIFAWPGNGNASPTLLTPLRAGPVITTPTACKADANSVQNNYLLEETVDYVGTELIFRGNRNSEESKNEVAVCGPKSVGNENKPSPSPLNALHAAPIRELTVFVIAKQLPVKAVSCVYAMSVAKKAKHSKLAKPFVTYSLDRQFKFLPDLYYSSGTLAGMESQVSESEQSWKRKNQDWKSMIQGSGNDGTNGTLQDLLRQKVPLGERQPRADSHAHVEGKARQIRFMDDAPRTKIVTGRSPLHGGTQVGEPKKETELSRTEIRPRSLQLGRNDFQDMSVNLSQHERMHWEPVHHPENQEATYPCDILNLLQPSLYF